MKAKLSVTACLLFLLSLGLLSLWAEPIKTTLVSSADLGGEERYRGHIALDKPIYRPGESVYARVTILDVRNNEPFNDGESLNATTEIKGPKGDIVSSGYAQGLDSVLGFSWKIPAEQAGGEYLLKVSFPSNGFPPAERKFDIRAFRAPRLKSQIVFLRDGYGPGDKAAASLHVERAEGGIPEGARVNISARVDGNEIHASTGKIDREGNCQAVFDLPANIEKGEGTLAMSIEDGGIVETAAKTIPILLQSLDVQIYPEGGDLVEGIQSRVYIEAKNFSQKPADISGIIKDDSGKTVTEFTTEHLGRGRFSFTPQKGTSYFLHITKPSGIKKEFPLPAVKTEGAVLTAIQEILGQGEKAKFKISSGITGNLKLTICRLETEIGSRKIAIKKGEIQEVAIDLKDTQGILIATLWSENGSPLAERLIFKKPAKKLGISISVKEKNSTPGSAVNLSIKTVDENNKPVGAVVGVTVTDESVLEMIEKREQPPRLPVMVLLENEVKELEDAHVYLDDTNPKSPAALDLLLGTQGWRRFALVNITKFFEEYGDVGRRATAIRIVTNREKEQLAVFADAMGEEEAMPQNAMARDKGAVPEPPPTAVPEQAPLEEMKEGKILNEPMPNPQIMPPPARDAAGPMAGALEAGNKKMMERELLYIPDINEPKNDMAYIRVYAHQTQPDRNAAERNDFTETVYWNAGVKTDNKTGEAKIKFQLSDSVTSFKVTADGFSRSGSLGEGNAAIESVKPFSIEPKIPLEVSAGDMTLIPIGVVNNTNDKLNNVTISPKAQDPLEPSIIKTFEISGKQRLRKVLSVFIGSGSIPVDLTLEAKAGSYQDKVTRKVSVKPRGFPIEVAFGGMLSGNAPYTTTVSIPANILAGSLSTKAVVYPSPLANLSEALERLMQEPNGCFEQTSSTNYPLVMAQQYFTTHTGMNPELIKKSQDLLEQGYKRLIGFECKNKGYEWFGGDPGHEALTAYGLLEFTDMGKVREVDTQMVERTKAWLLARRDGKGGFLRDSKAIDSFGRAPEATTNAYITWALLEAGEKNLEKEVAQIREQAGKSDDSYIIALGANVMNQSGDKDGAKKLMEKLAKKQSKNGDVQGASTSITQSSGEALAIETTSLAVSAWLQNPNFAANVENAMKFLAEQCKSGRFSSTQSTILALKAIIAYDKARSKPKAPGSVRLYIDGTPAGNSVSFDEKTKEVIQLPDFNSLLKAGNHTIELKMTDGSDMPFSLTVNYFSDQPANSNECKLSFETSLRDSKIREGKITEVQVKVANKTDGALPMPVAIIGIPGGLEPRHDQLKELVKSKTIDAYEVIGRNIILYWRAMKPSQVNQVTISLTAAIPGNYEGPACRAYQYYCDEHKIWTPGLKVEITPSGS